MLGCLMKRERWKTLYCICSRIKGFFCRELEGCESKKINRVVPLILASLDIFIISLVTSKL